MKMFDFENEQKRMFDDINKNTAKKETEELETLEKTLKLWEEFITKNYPNIIVKMLEEYYNSISGENNYNIEENKDNIFLSGYIIIRSKSPDKLQNNSLNSGNNKKMGFKYEDTTVEPQQISLSLDSNSKNIILKFKYDDTKKEFNDMLDRFISRHSENISRDGNILRNGEFNDNSCFLYISGTYKKLKEIYYEEMQVLEYLYENIDKSRVTTTSKEKK